jgi:hypothetical protein
MTPEELLDAAWQLVVRPTQELAGLWPRAAALAGRRALEETLDEFWLLRAPGLEAASARAQLACLPSFLNPAELAREVSYAWMVLSHACHHHAYELGPTAEELQARLETVQRLIDRIHEQRR